MILVRCISWWDSGQLKRAVSGIVLATLPLLWDLFERNTLTWRSGISAVMAGLFAWIGLSRVKAPDVITGNATLDRANVQALVPASLISDLKQREEVRPPKVT